MEHQDHIALIREGVNDTSHEGSDAPPVVWADFGAGRGAFTMALADLLGPLASLHAVDRDRDALRENERRMRARFPHASVQYHAADFTAPLALPPLDGIVMANALHFIRDKSPTLARIRGALKPGGRFILVEYDTDRGNHWVPYPLSYPAWESLASATGFAHTCLLARRPSRFLGAIYAALST